MNPTSYPELKHSMLGADIYMAVSISPKPEGVQGEDIGLKWLDTCKNSLKLIKTIKIHGDDWAIVDLLPMLEDVKADKLQPAKWKPRDALVKKDGSRATIYTGQDFDSTQYEIKRNFWDHDHCQVCSWTFVDSADPEQVNGYTDGYNWVCSECYRRFIEGKELADLNPEP